MRNANKHAIYGLPELFQCPAMIGLSCIYGIFVFKHVNIMSHFELLLYQMYFPKRAQNLLKDQGQEKEGQVKSCMEAMDKVCVSYEQVFHSPRSAFKGWGGYCCAVRTIPNKKYT